MLEKIMMDGEPPEVGDRVWCLLRGWGKVIKLEPGFFDSITVLFGEHEYAYRSEGLPKLSGVFQQVRTLYWDEIKITPPPKPKKKVKVWDWFVQWEFQGSTRIDKLCATTEGLVRKTYTGAECIIQKIDGTEREVIQ